MMARKRVALEIYNDVNGRLVNWWLAVIDQPTEFARLIEFTPYSQELFEQAMAQVDDPELPAIRRALALHICVSQSNLRTDSKQNGGWSIHYNPSVGSIIAENWVERVKALSARMCYVQIRRKPAVDELRRVADLECAVVYVDPPYPSANTTPYEHNAIDKDELTAALQAQKGFCAVSGYGDEWAHLGWQEWSANALRRQLNGKAEPRVEKLWTNRHPPQLLI